MSVQTLAALPETGSEWQEARERLYLTRAELARSTGLDQTTFWRLENDRAVSDRVRRLVAANLGLGK
jgi:DNA-binding XRE family transcriptional regulator